MHVRVQDMQRTSRESLPVVQVHVGAAKFEPLASSKMKPLAAYFSSGPRPAAVASAPPPPTAMGPPTPVPLRTRDSPAQIDGTKRAVHDQHAARGAVHASAQGPASATGPAAAPIAGSPSDGAGSTGGRDGAHGHAVGQSAVDGHIGGEEVTGMAVVEGRDGVGADCAAPPAQAAVGACNAAVRLREDAHAGSGGAAVRSTLEGSVGGLPPANAMDCAETDDHAAGMGRRGRLGWDREASEPHAWRAGDGHGPSAPPAVGAAHQNRCRAGDEDCRAGSGGAACAVGGEVRSKRSRDCARVIDLQERIGSGAAPAGGSCGGVQRHVAADVDFEAVLGWWESGALDCDGAARVSSAVMQGLAGART